MLAGMRSLFLFCCFLAFSAGTCLPLHAQINGVPASVTSFGFGGSTNPTPGVRASVTSLGPNGYANNNSMFFGNCCANFFFPANPNPSLFPDHSQHHKTKSKNKDRSDNDLVGVVEPAYIPYPVPYAAETDDDSSGSDGDDPQVAAQSNGVPKPPVHRHNIGPSDGSSKPNFVESNSAEPEPVAVQPSTTLVFKDGHKSDVLNYAIVGDTLFDFADGRSRKILLADLDIPATRKINDDRGVDFQIPANTARQ